MTCRVQTNPQDKILKDIFHKLSSAENDVAILKREKIQRKAINVDFKNKLISREAYSKRNNFIFYNIQEDQTPLQQTICKIFLSSMAVSKGECYFL